MTKTLLILSTIVMFISCTAVKTQEVNTATAPAPTDIIEEVTKQESFYAYAGYREEKIILNKDLQLYSMPGGKVIGSLNAGDEVSLLVWNSELNKKTSDVLVTTATNKDLWLGWLLFNEDDEKQYHNELHEISSWTTETVFSHDYQKVLLYNNRSMFFLVIERQNSEVYNVSENNVMKVLQSHGLDDDYYYWEPMWSSDDSIIYTTLTIPVKGAPELGMFFFSLQRNSFKFIPGVLEDIYKTPEKWEHLFLNGL